jgi:hypothetical protein
MSQYRYLITKNPVSLRSLIQRLRIPQRKRLSVSTRAEVFAHNIMDKVKILDLNLTGTVVSLSINMTGAQYEIRYFWEGEHKYAHLYAWEIADA